MSLHTWPSTSSFASRVRWQQQWPGISEYQQPSHCGRVLIANLGHALKAHQRWLRGLPAPQSRGRPVARREQRGLGRRSQEHPPAAVALWRAGETVRQACCRLGQSVSLVPLPLGFTQRFLVFITALGCAIVCTYPSSSLDSDFHSFFPYIISPRQPCVRDTEMEPTNCSPGGCVKPGSITVQSRSRAGAGTFPLTPIGPQCQDLTLCARRLLRFLSC